MPPEIERGGPATTLTDIYQYGLCLLSMYRQVEEYHGTHFRELKLGLPDVSFAVACQLALARAYRVAAIQLCQDHASLLCGEEL